MVVRDCHTWKGQIYPTLPDHMHSRCHCNTPDLPRWPLDCTFIMTKVGLNLEIAVGREAAVSRLNLETAVGSQKSAQALDAPGKIKKCLITSEVTTTFFISSCTPISYTTFLRPTAVSDMYWPVNYWDQVSMSHAFTHSLSSQSLAQSRGAIYDGGSLWYTRVDTAWDIETWSQGWT